MLLPVLEFVVAGLLVLLAIRKIILPILRGTPIFSTIQKRNSLAKLESARNELRIAELEREIADIKRREQDVRLASLQDELGRFAEGTPREVSEKGKASVSKGRID